MMRAASVRTDGLAPWEGAHPAITIACAWCPIMWYMKETSEIYANIRGEDVVGLTIINAEPRELTIVNIVGPVDLDKLSNLEGQFGIPHLSRRSNKEQHHE